MKFVTFNTKSLLVIFAILFTITLTCINSSEVASTIKTETNSQMKNKNKSNSLLKNKSTSKLTLKKKKYSMSNPPGASELNPTLTPTSTTAEPKTLKTPAPTTPTVTATKPAQPAKVQATKGTGDILLNDWLQIASKGFHNHYNEIDMGFHGDNIRIKTDHYDFRINDAHAKDKNPQNQPPSEELFWFRLTKDLVFYSNTKHDLNLLGGMKISEIVDSEGEKRGEKGDHCFVITDMGNHDWQICSEHELVRNTWYCKIQELRKEPKPEYCNALNPDDNTKVIIKNVRKNFKN